MTSEQYKRLQHLNEKINKGLADDNEKQEYVRILKDNGTITQEQYDKYNKSNDDGLLKIILIVGGIALLAYLISNNDK